MEMNKEIEYVIEVYMDEFNTLRQSIMYKFGDENEMIYRRNCVNPNLSELVRTIYLNRDHEICEPRSENKHVIHGFRKDA